jgi:single-strand DNA-binding protein
MMSAMRLVFMRHDTADTRGKTGDTISDLFMHQGRAKVYVEGQLQTGKWTDQGGQEHYTTDVGVARFKVVMTMLSRANNGERSEADGTSGGGYLPRGGRGGCAAPDDEIPFAPQVL